MSKSTDHSLAPDYQNRNHEVINLLLQGYPDNDSLYHNREHALNTMARTAVNRQILEQAGVELVSETELQIAAAGHDTLKLAYDIDTDIRKRYNSAEAYAVHTTDTLMRLYNYDETTRGNVAKLIMATKPGVAASNWSELSLVFADIEPVCYEDTSQMYSDTHKLRIEHIMHAPDPGEIGFKALSVGVLATIYAVNLGAKEVSNVSFFHQRREQMRQNILQLAKQTAEEAGESIKELITRLSPGFLEPVLRLTHMKPNDQSAN